MGYGGKQEVDRVDRLQSPCNPIPHASLALQPLGGKKMHGHSAQHLQSYALQPIPHASFLLRRNMQRGKATMQTPMGYGVRDKKMQPYGFARGCTSKLYILLLPLWGKKMHVIRSFVKDAKNELCKRCTQTRTTSVNKKKYEVYSSSF